MARIAKMKIHTLKMKNKHSTKTKNIFLVGLVLLGLANLFLGIIPTMIFVFLILSVQFYTLNKYESAFLLSLFANTLGTFFAIKGVRGVGSLFFLFSFIIFALDFKYLYGKYIKYLIPLLLIFVLFMFSVLFSEGGDYAQKKLLDTLTVGLLSSFAFAHFFYYNHKYRPYLIGLFTIIYALFILKYSIDYYGFSNPKNLFDIGLIRNMIVDIQITDFDLKINYQRIGFMGVFSLSLLFFNPKIKIAKYLYVLIYFLSILVVLYSGSRQALLTLIIIISLHILRKNRLKMNLRNYVLFFVFIISVWYIFQSSDVWFLSDIKNTSNIIETSGRSDLINLALKQFYEHPMIGVGYGRYINPDNVYGGSPHNIFIELLTEIGFLGVFFILSILIVFFIKHFIYLKANSYALFGVYCILISYFIRSLVSAEMSYNIELFAVLFMVPLFRLNDRRKYKLSTK